MIRRPPRSTLSSSSAASDVYKRQVQRLTMHCTWGCAVCDSTVIILLSCIEPGSVVAVLQAQLVLLLSVDLPGHAASSATKDNVRNQIDNLGTASQVTNADCEDVANDGQALDAIVEPNDLVIALVWDQVVFNHEVCSCGRDGQTRAADALQAHATGPAVRILTHASVQALLAARRESLATVVLAPVLVEHAPAKAPIGPVGSRDTGEDATARGVADGALHWHLEGVNMAGVTAVRVVLPLERPGCGLSVVPALLGLSLIHISEPTRLLSISYAVFCLKKKKKTT
eukprot:TRINITY_DN19284_c0_g2_i1.p1 TRINITY_DN19284_c0_g2~~TRINITY_DN19284_c0_g2_i1.p1  ORF type:complete len:285 (-),score=41.02 TRINITY_DN19284_c0_g2_i1:81-935(-)